MEMDVNRLTPGMVLTKDVVGKSRKTIIPENTELTDLHIEFLKKFLIEKVSISPLKTSNENVDQKEIETLLDNSKEKQILEYTFHQSVQLYKNIFERVMNNVSLEIYKVRETWIPIFRKISEQPLERIIKLLNTISNREMFYAKNVATTMLTVALVKRLGYEEKDLYQIGFAALLCDIGIAKLEEGIHTSRNEQWRMHPIYSYRLIENEVTINKHAKLAILQHHEYLDGTGFPSGYTKEKIHPFAQVIAVCDYVITEYKKNNLDHVITLLNTYKNRKFSEKIVTTIIESLQE